MGGYALVKDGVVINTILWDGETEVDFGKGVSAIEMTQGQAVSTGYSYQNGEFSAPPLSDEEIAERALFMQQSNASQKSALFNEATSRISVLQDAVELEMASEEETAALPLWKKYRVLLSRVDASTSEEIKWPKKPSF